MLQMVSGIVTRPILPAGPAGPKPSRILSIRTNRHRTESENFCVTNNKTSPLASLVCTRRPTDRPTEITRAAFMIWGVEGRVGLNCLPAASAGPPVAVVLIAKTARERNARALLRRAINSRTRRPAPRPAHATTRDYSIMCCKPTHLAGGGGWVSTEQQVVLAEFCRSELRHRNERRK